jgi:hypothetical protein
LLPLLRIGTMPLPLTEKLSRKSSEWKTLYWKWFGSHVRLNIRRHEPLGNGLFCREKGHTTEDHTGQVVNWIFSGGQRLSHDS